MQEKSISTRKIVLTALLAALTVVGSGIRVTLPLDIAGTTSFHLGNIMCALSGILLGPWLGGLAAGLGSFLYDMTNPLYVSEAWITFLTKGIYGLFPGLVITAGRKNWGYGRALAGSIAGAATYAVLYLMKTYFYSGLLMHGLTPDAAMLLARLADGALRDGLSLLDQCASVAQHIDMDTVTGCEWDD